MFQRLMCPRQSPNIQGTFKMLQVHLGASRDRGMDVSETFKLQVQSGYIQNAPGTFMVNSKCPSCILGTFKILQVHSGYIQNAPGTFRVHSEYIFFLMKPSF